MSPSIRHHPRALLTASVLALLSVLAATFAASASTARHPASVPTYGGTLHVAYSGNMITFDPAQAFNDDWWVMNGTLFDGLYQDDRNGIPQLDLAAAPPTIGADRKNWTFHLRQGVRFSNGMEVTADDLRFSIMRTLDPHLKPAPSWGQSTDAIFQGAQDFIAGKAKDVPGIKALDRYTIRFALVQPVAVFPFILAETFNMVVPKAVVTNESADYFASHPVGTGPFILKSWQKGSQLTFVRNPYYFRKGLPYVNKLIIDQNVSSNLIALRVEKGEIDGSGNGSELAASDLQQARADPKYAHYLVNGPLIWMSWLYLNVKAPPLDNPKMRQAIAMAVNRVKLVQLDGGNAIPAGNVYLPIYPHNDPSLDRKPVYPYDPRQAAALAKASGYHGQPITIYYASDFGYNANLAAGVQQDLQQIGVNVTLRSSTTTSLNAIDGKFTGHQISFFSWSPDYPDGYDVYSSQFACGVNVEGGISGAHYCDPTADDLANRSELLPIGPARNALLRQAQLRILRSAAYVPLVYLKNIALVNPRVGGFYYHPLYGWQYENYWLK